MESALVTAGFVTSLRTPLFTSNTVKTEQVEKNGAGEYKNKKKRDHVTLQPVPVFIIRHKGERR